MKFLTVMLVSVMTCVTPVVLTTLTAFAKNSNPQTDKIYQSAKFQLQKREQQLKNESVSEWYIPGQSPLLVQIFSANGQLLSEKMDSNMDGFFEKRIFYDHKQRTRTEKNYEPTEKHLLTETVQKLSSNKRMLLNTTQYNSKSAVIGKTQYQLPLADVLNQTNAECKTGAQSTVFGQIEALKPLINELLITERNDQFVVTSFGAKIETSCLKQHGDDFPQLVQQSLRENINCLADLGGNGSHENIAKIASLLENKKRPWKIICSDKEAFEGISNTKGLGSVEGIHADFPWIKLNPDLEGSNPKALRGLIFHEILHNCGHIHAPGNIEYMYACELCCENNFKPVSACKVCQGNYKSANDPAYLLDYSNSGAIPNQSLRLLQEMRGVASSGKNEKLPYYLNHLALFPIDDYNQFSKELTHYLQSEKALIEVKDLKLPSNNKSELIKPEIRNFAKALQKLNDPYAAITELEKNKAVLDKMDTGNPLKDQTITLLEIFFSELDINKNKDDLILRSKIEKLVQNSGAN